MTEEEHTQAEFFQNPTDVNQLIAAAKFTFKWNEKDSGMADIEQFVEDKDAFIDSLKQSPWFVDLVQSAANHHACGTTLELPGLECKIIVTNRSNAVEIIIWCTSRKWIMELEGKSRRIFASAARISCERDIYSTRLLARHLGIRPMSEFKTLQPFDVSSITDYLGKGVDANIADLVKILNEMGLTTTSSCGGHEDGRNPYLDFDIDAAERLIALLEQWRKAGGLSYDLRKSERGETISLVPPKLATRAVLQEDFQHLTEFLRRKLRGIKASKATVQGLQYRFTRFIDNCLKNLRQQ